jgi:excisionase family DNA binding protein
MIDSLDGLKAEWVTAPEAARLLSVSRPRIHQLVKAHVLDGTRVLGPLLVHRRSIDEWALVRRPAGRPRVRKPPTLEGLRARRPRILALARERNLQNVRVFGSVARGDATPESDIDLIVDPLPGWSALDITELMFVLEQELGQRVDVAVVGRPSAVTDRILAEAVPL